MLGSKAGDQGRPGGGDPCLHHRHVGQVEGHGRRKADREHGAEKSGDSEVTENVRLGESDRVTHTFSLKGKSVIFIEMASKGRLCQLEAVLEISAVVELTVLIRAYCANLHRYEWY